MKKEDIEKIIENKKQFKTLIDHIPACRERTKIKDIKLKKNKDGFEVFKVVGKEFSRSFIIEHGSIFFQTKDKIVFKVDMSNNFSIRS